MSILQNAIDSISIGLEDFELAQNDKRRLISSTRNIFAGILLLFKYKLSNLSPKNSDEVLIKQKIIPKVDDSKLIWVGKGKKTVDVQGIKNRFESLDIKVNWKKFDKINDYRNNIEHYYSNQSEESVATLISDSFILIQDFIIKYLDKDPKKLLGKKAWEKLVSINEVHKKDKEFCIKKLEKQDWETDYLFEAIINFNCNNCGSDLLTIKSEDNPNTFICRSCEEEYTLEEISEDALSQLYNSYNKDGGEPELITCPYCLKETYLYYEQQCGFCGEEASHICVRCGQDILADEISDDNLCGYCKYQYEKLMSE